MQSILFIKFLNCIPKGTSLILARIGALPYSSGHQTLVGNSILGDVLRNFTGDNIQWLDPAKESHSIGEDQPVKDSTELEGPKGSLSVRLCHLSVLQIWLFATSGNGKQFSFKAKLLSVPE